MGPRIVRTIVIVCKIGMTNLAYNMRRFVCLKKDGDCDGVNTRVRRLPKVNSSSIIKIEYKPIRCKPLAADAAHSSVAYRTRAGHFDHIVVRDVTALYGIFTDLWGNS
jgi:hypothetical protein